MRKTVLICDHRQCNNLIGDSSERLYTLIRTYRHRSAPETRTNPAGSSEKYYTIVDLCETCAEAIGIDDVEFSEMSHEEARRFLYDSNCVWQEG